MSGSVLGDASNEGNRHAQADPELERTSVRFHLEQAFSAPVDDVARAFTELGFYELLAGLPKLGRPDVLERREDGDRVHLRVRYRFTGDLSAAARRVLDPSRLT